MGAKKIDSQKMLKIYMSKIIIKITAWENDNKKVTMQAWNYSVRQALKGVEVSLIQAIYFQG